MNTKKLAVIALAGLLTVPAFAAASQFTATKTGEKVVEGHTVFAVLEKRVDRQGFDIAVLVREVEVGPNVLWFNDQFKTFFQNVRYPCGGYVLATWTGIDPLFVISKAVVGLDGLGITYVESYHITDPNGFESYTHLYSITGLLLVTVPVWITEVQGVLSVGDDDGVANCAPISDTAAHDDPGDNGETYNDNLDSAPVRIYNADIFGLWDDVQAEGAKNHGTGGSDDSDGTGCEDGTEWECDGADADGDADGREGNSHPYNPLEVGSGPAHTHETGLLDVHFASTLGVFNTLGGYPPATPNVVVDDTEVVESEIVPCQIQAGGFDDHC